MANGNYEKRPPSASQGSLLARMMIDGVPALQKEVPNAAEADDIINGVKRESGGDANDLLYAFESSRDFNGEPSLPKVSTKVFALNFAGDESYHESLPSLEKDAQSLAQRQVVIRPVSMGSVVHLSIAHPGLWKGEADKFMEWVR